MARHFIAVGGSGQHAALALADLMALAHHLLSKPLELVKFYVLDRDVDAEGAGRTAWQEVERQLRALHAADEGLSSRVQAPDQNSRIRPSPELPEKRVSELVSRAYGPLLFNSEQLEVEFRSGYFGQAPVASALFGDMIKRDAKTLGETMASIVADKDARIAVAGSVVGGTGAGCLPELVSYLSKENRESTVLALVMLRWYKLAEDAEGGKARRRNDEMRSREPSALLYAAKELANQAKTVLLAHPDVESAGQKRPWAGDTQQPVHSDLSIPYYAAAVASSYLFEGSATVKGLYSVACPEQSGLQLPATLGAFPSRYGDGENQLKLKNLFQRNYEFCKRMHWTLRYLDSSPESRWSFWSRALQVPALEDFRNEHPGSLQNLKQNAETLLEAKWNALRRLAASDRELFGEWQLGNSKPYKDHFSTLGGGLSTLKGWFKGSAQSTPSPLRTLSALVNAGIGDTTGVSPEPSTRRCLPPVVAGATTIAPATIPSGELDQMDFNQIKQLCDSEQVRAGSLPTPKAVEWLLAKVFESTANSKDQELRGEQKEWRERWLKLLLGLSTGALSLREGPKDAGKVQLFPKNSPLIVDQFGQVVGYCSPETLVVPAVGADWGQLSDALPLEEGSAGDRLEGWVDLIFHWYPEADPPAWLLELKRWSNARGGNKARGVGLSPVSFEVRWGERMLKMKLPAEGQRHVEQVSDILSLLGHERRVYNLKNLPEPIRELEDPERFPIYHPIGEDGEVGKARKLVWKELNEGLCNTFEHGFSMPREEGEARRIIYEVNDESFPGGLEVRSIKDVWVDRVTPLKNNEKTEYPDYPIRLRYADLIDRKHPLTEPRKTPGGVIPYTIRLRGFDKAEEKLFEANEELLGNFFLWPKFRSPSETSAKQECFKAYHVLSNFYSGNLTVKFAGRKHVRSEHLDWAENLSKFERGQPLYRIEKTALASGGIPEFFSISQNSGSGHNQRRNEGGLFATRLEPLDLLSSEKQEQWGIDFGTNSTVVAIRGDAPKPTLVRPLGSYDQTKVFGFDEDVPLRGCNWFPTWSDDGPRREVPPAAMPSQLLLMGREDAWPTPEQLIHSESMPYGKAFILDPGIQLDEALSSHKRIKGKLKWLGESQEGDSEGLERQRALRRSYLLHLIEFVSSIRPKMRGEGIKERLPQSVMLVFTLPLEMRHKISPTISPASLFEEDVDKVLELATPLLGINFETSYLWESLAGAPAESLRNDGEIHAVADLGGGSLDLWGLIGKNREFADSYRFGGHDLLNRWSGSEDLQAQVNLRREIEDNSLDALKKIESDPEMISVQRGFFQLVREAVARWVAAVAMHDEARQETTVSLGLLGMGWSLDGTTLGDTFWSNIEARVNELLDGKGPRVRVVKAQSNESESSEGVDRKSYLAWHAAALGGKARRELEAEKIRYFPGFNLVEVQEGQAVQEIPWHSSADISLKASDTSSVSSRLTLERNSRTQPLPLLPHHELSPQSLNDILTEIQGSIRGSGDVYSGRAPFALMLDRLRHDPKANRR